MFVIIGTTTVDLIVRGISPLAAMGDGFRADNLAFCPQPLLMLMGGNGGNAAYVLGKLGADVVLCSSIGQDDLGDWLAAHLADQAVGLTGLLRQADLATSTSTILLDKDESQFVFHHKGATEALRLTAVHQTLCSKATVLLATSYTLCPHLRAGGLADALQLAHRAGAITALDIGPAIGDPVTTAEIQPLFPHLHHLIANEHELLACTGEADWETAVAHLLAHGCPSLIIKRGAAGSALRSPQHRLDMPAMPVSANISAGAGDAFNAGFLYKLWHGQNAAQPIDQHLLNALHFGNVIAALVVSRERGILSAPTLNEVEAILRD